MVLLLLLTSLAGVSPIRAEEGQTDEVSPEEWWKIERFAIEWFGGIADFSASDLNALVTYDNQVQHHMYDAQLDSLQARGQIQSWDSALDGERRPLESSWTTGLRARFRLNAFFSLSFGLQYLSAGGSKDLRLRYSRLEHNTDERIEELDYSPYTLSVGAYAPLLGITVGKPLGEKIELEGYVLGGPLFARFDYVSDWDYAFSIDGPSMYGRALLFATEGRFEGEGKGTGLALDMGMRFKYMFLDRVGIFVEGGYAYQHVNNPSGSGSETRNGDPTNWEGMWTMGEETLATPWGTVELERPTNRGMNGSARDFELDLSGFQLRLGISFRI
jgi:hypothetical protein